MPDPAASLPAASRDPSPGGQLERYLGLVSARAPALARTLSTHGAGSIRDYLRVAFPVTERALQPRDDLCEAVYAQAEPLLGAHLAGHARAALEARPLALTANHHGVDFFAQSLQGTLLFALGESHPGHIAPVFACGAVPLDNLTFPMGLLLYGANAPDLGNLPARLAVFSNRHRREMVGNVGGIDAAMRQRAAERCAAMASSGELPAELAGVVTTLLGEDYAAPEVAALTDYSRQAVVLNQRLWRRLFRDPVTAPGSVTLDLERLAAELLRRDLARPSSLAWNVHFDTALREAVCTELDGAPGCWDGRQLLARNAGEVAGAASPRGAGSFLYWGISERRRRVPLYPGAGSAGAVVLRGQDDKGAGYEFALTPESLRTALAEQRIVPSLFGCFLAIALARGVTCVGAYYQAEYLPAMQAGLAAALRRTGDAGAAETVQAVPADAYLAGMQALMCRHPRGLVPAGPAEIIAAGGLDADAVQRMLELPVHTAHAAGLFESVPDLLAEEQREPHWRNAVAGECTNLPGLVILGAPRG